MGEKYHINNRGVPALCYAKDGNCPLDREGHLREHYLSKEEAQDAVDKFHEEKHGILSAIESNNVGDDEEVRVLAGSVISKAEKIGIANDAERAYIERIKDPLFVSRTRDPQYLQSEFGVDTNKFNREFGKRLSRNTELLSEVISEVNKIERKYNVKMKDYIAIKTEERVEKSSGVSGEISAGVSSKENPLKKLLKAPFRYVRGVLTGELKLTGGRKKVTVESQNLKMGKRHVRNNEKIKFNREKLEIEKERELAALNNSLVEVSRSNKYFKDKALNSHLRGRIELIGNPVSRRQALAYLEEKENLLFKTHISENDMMSIEYKFKEAYEEKDEVKMRSCNRIVNMLGDNDRDIITYFDKGINEGTFNKNYEKLKSGDLFSVLDENELSKKVIELDKKTYDCFDT